jgi:putative transcriptional regulator
MPTGKHDWSRADAMTDVEVQAAAMRDPDTGSMTDEEFANAQLMPRTRTLRRALGLTRKEFAARFHIPLNVLCDWEEGRAEPDLLELTPGPA